MDANTNTVTQLHLQNNYGAHIS